MAYRLWGASLTWGFAKFPAYTFTESASMGYLCCGLGPGLGMWDTAVNKTIEVSKSLPSRS